MKELLRRPWRRSFKRAKPSAEGHVPENKGQSDPPAQAERNPDAPIQSLPDDKLGRADFARTLAEDVRGAPRRGGFVIALTGRWGEGKTSVINLMIDELKGEVDVVHFNPWLFSGTEQLVEHFFDELSSQLRETGRERLNEVAGALDAYRRVVAPLTIVPGLGELVRSSRDVAEKVGGAIGIPTPSARVRAKQVAEQLRKLDRRILVVVDDLDRLRRDEMVDVMRLVRLVGDFPNLVYILAFDRPRVEEALGDGQQERGQAYLEKIVQVIHRLPETDPAALSKLLEAELSAALGDVRERFNHEHFANLFSAGTRDLFATVRDIHRYTNTLPATVALVGDEVELADVLSLEAIRVFLPDSFDRLVEAKHALTSVGNQMTGQATRQVRQQFPRRLRPLCRIVSEHSAQQLDHGARHPVRG